MTVSTPICADAKARRKALTAPRADRGAGFVQRQGSTPCSSAAMMRRGCKAQALARIVRTIPRDCPGRWSLTPLDHAQTDQLKTLLLALAFTALGVGLGLQFSGRSDLAQAVWFGGVVPVLQRWWSRFFRSLFRGEVGLDIVAALSMSAALPLTRRWRQQSSPSCDSGGTFLEIFAEGRARREMRDLLSRVPRTATRHRDGGLEEVALDVIAPGDRLLIRQGDIVPVDGRIASATAFLDTAALTGESLPMRLDRGPRP